MTTISSSAFRLDLSSVSTIATLAAALKAEIPGLTTYTDYSTGRGTTLLCAHYACPCGEASKLCVEFYEAPMAARVRDHVERIKHLLREHVRGEDNEPNF
jgi:hypothetical protein